MPYSSTSAAATSSCVDERVRRAEDDVRAARLERAREVRRLGRDVQAAPRRGARRAAARARSARGSREHRHLPVRPLDPAHAFGGEREILHVVSLRRLPSFLSSLSVVGLQAPQASELRSCFRCSHSTHPACRRSAVGTFVPRARSRPRPRSVGLAPEPQGERELVELDAEAVPEVSQVPELVQLADAVEPIAGRRSGRHDETRVLEVAEHSRRPPERRCLADRDRSTRNLTTLVSRWFAPRSAARVAGTGVEWMIDVVVSPCGVKRSSTSSRSSIERRWSRSR